METPAEHRISCGLLVRDGSALLVHRLPTKARNPNVWDLPGGHIDPGETASEALVRELQEELGVEIAAPITDPLLRLRTPGVDLSIWRIDHWTGDIRNAAPDEHDAIGWFTLDEVEDLHVVSQAHREMLRRELS